MGNSNLLFESIFKRKFSEAGTAGYLNKLIKEHPYFSAAHFFLLLQTEKDSPFYNTLAAKTSLLFNNPYWLQFRLQEEKQNVVEFINPAVRVDNDEFVNNFGLVEDYNGATPSTETSNQATATHQGLGEDIISGFEEVPQLELPSPSAPVIDNEGDVISEKETIAIAGDEPAGSPVDDIINDPFNGDEIAGSEIGKVEENNLNGASPEKEADLITSAQTDLEDTEDTKIAQAIITHDSIENGVLKEPGNGAETIDQPTTRFNNEKIPLVNESEADDGQISEKEIEPLNFKLNIDPANTTSDTILFEPLHTSDYFASQGIKLSGEVKPSDKLGKQLKSFTEWLKTMKKIHSDQLPPLNGQTDLSIRKLAEQSNKDDAVVTEAMADVLLQQGKIDKALEVYKKLSLLNPSKSAYFAAKIDQLKEH